MVELEKNKKLVNLDKWLKSSNVTSPIEDIPRIIDKDSENILRNDMGVFLCARLQLGGAAHC